MTERDYARKLDELDRILNDPEVPMEAGLVWSLLDELSASSDIAVSPISSGIG